MSHGFTLWCFPGVQKDLLTHELGARSCARCGARLSLMPDSEAAKAEMISILHGDDGESGSAWKRHVSVGTWPRNRLDGTLTPIFRKILRKIGGGLGRLRYFSPGVTKVTVTPQKYLKRPNPPPIFRIILQKIGSGVPSRRFRGHFCVSLQDGVSIFWPPRVCQIPRCATKFKGSESLVDPRVDD